MPAQSDYLRNKLLEHLDGATYTGVSTVYLGVFTTPVNADESGTEVSGGGYARKAVTFAAASGGSISSSSAVTWSPLHTSSTLTLFGWGIFDSLSGGNMLYYGQFSSPFTVASGTDLTFAAGDITVTVARTARGGLTDYTANKWLDLTLRNQVWLAPTVYLGFLTDVDAGTEVSGGGYARKASGFTVVASIGTVTPDTWSPLSTAADTSVQGHGWWDASTAGNLLAYWYTYDDTTQTLDVPQNDDLDVASLTVTAR